MRRPLFEEILAMSPSNPELDYGIPSNALRRQRSEGSMHSPSPMSHITRTELLKMEIDGILILG